MSCNYCKVMTNLLAVSYLYIQQRLINLIRIRFGLTFLSNVYSLSASVFFFGTHQLLEEISGS